MSNQYNSFLPTGGIEYQPKDPLARSSSVSPLSVPRRFQTNNFMSAPNTGHSAHNPLSPPQSRSPSAENASAAMLEDWRSYTANLRSQFQGERAHLLADRGRMEECMEEERQLWELERSYFVAQVAELEAKLDQMRSRADSLEKRLQDGPTSQPMSTSSSTSGTIPKASKSFGLRSLSSSSHDSSSSHYGAQESGRDADGSPFYAPAPRNPTRTFGSTEASNLRIDSITSANENVIQISNKAFKASDFERTTSGMEIHYPIAEIPASIDISLIEPGLEGVSIKASAVHPTFAAKILSPVTSPSDKVPARPEEHILGDATNGRTKLSRSSSNAEDRTKNTLEVANAPENRRLTMNAGHTPSHSITKIPWLNDDGDATPRQQIIHKGAIDRRASMALSLVSAADDDEEEEHEDGDKELTGSLGLTNEPISDNPFLAALTEKLVEVQKSQPTSPSESDAAQSTSSSSTASLPNGKDEEEDEEEEEVPRMKIRPSMNFGRPMGSM